LLNFNEETSFCIWCAFFRSCHTLRGSVLWSDLGSLILPVTINPRARVLHGAAQDFSPELTTILSLFFVSHRDLSSHSSASFLRVGFVDLTASCQCVVPGLVFSVSFLPEVRRSLLLSFFCSWIRLSFWVPMFWVLLPLIFVVAVFCFGLSASRFGRVRAGVNLHLQSVLFPAAKPQVSFSI
jgi:hypothetical protein